MKAPYGIGAETPWQQVGAGVERQILTWDAELMLVRVRFAEGAVGVAHHHPHRQTSYVESGVFRVHVGGAERVLRAGDSFFAVPEVVHGVVALEAGSLLDVFTPARADFVPGELTPAAGPAHGQV